MMERLILKLPDKKPPFIGICYEPVVYGHSCGEDHEVLVHANLSPKIMHIETRQDISVLNIAIELVITNAKFHYQVPYDHNKLISWLASASEATIINFGHLMLDSNSVPQLLRTKSKNLPFYFPLERIYWIRHQDKKVIKMYNY